MSSSCDALRLGDNLVGSPSGGGHWYYKMLDDGLKLYSNGHKDGLDVKFYGNSYVRAYGLEANLVKPARVTSQQFVELLERQFAVILKQRNQPSTSPISYEKGTKDKVVAVLEKLDLTFLTTIGALWPSLSRRY